MKVFLQFDLPADKEEHQMALDGWKYQEALRYINGALDALMQGESEQYRRCCEDVRGLIAEQIDELGLEI